MRWVHDFTTPYCYPCGHTHLLTQCVLPARMCDQCAWYAMNFAVDVSAGVVLNIAMLKTLRVCAYRCDWNALKISGDYGRPPRLR